MLSIFHVINLIVNLLLVGESDENIHTLLVLTSIDSANGLFNLVVDFIRLVKLVDVHLLLNRLCGAILTGLGGSDVNNDRWLSHVVKLWLLHWHESGHHS